MKNFTKFLAIDWSGARLPVLTPAIAVAVCGAGTRAPSLLPEPWSRAKVFDLLSRLAKEKTRTLVGIDCNFGYSETVGERQFGKNYTAQDLWNAVEAANESHDNFFAGGYWTHPDHGRHFWVDGAMRPGFEMPRRATEQVCGESGLGWPESPFKLIGAKQVGKGGLAGMRLALALKKTLQDRIAFWPFETDTDAATLVVTEIYPRLFLKKAGHGNAKIRDSDALNRVLAALGSENGLFPAFSDQQADALASAAGLRSLCGHDTKVPENIATPPALRKTLAREGWIFGAGA